MKQPLFLSKVILRLLKGTVIQKHVKRKFILSGKVRREWDLINQRHDNQAKHPENLKQRSSQLSKAQEHA